MKTNSILSVAALVAADTLTPNLFAGECTASKTASAATCTPGDDIVAVAAGAENFKTLVAAVKAAGLVETLQGAGPFTVFAPTDEAFARLPAGTLESLLKPENKDKLIAILKYHVVPGKVLAADVKTHGDRRDMERGIPEAPDHARGGAEEGGGTLGQLLAFRRLNR